jgi:hypothetical protein
MSLLENSGAARLKALVLRIGIILAIFIAAIGGALFFANLGPRRAVRPKDYQQERREAEDYKTKSRELWERYIVVVETNPDLLPGPEDIRNLEQALEWREKYIQLNERQSDPEGLIEEIRKAWQTVRARECRQKSKEAERRGLAAFEKENYAEAETAFGEAVRLENLIGDNYQLSAMRDVFRLSNLEQDLKKSKGRPIYLDTKKLETKADAIVLKHATNAANASDFAAGKARLLPAVPADDAGDVAAFKAWDEAAALYREAWRKSLLLRDSYSGLFNLEYSYPERLEAKYETCLATPENIRIQRLLSDVRRITAQPDYSTSKPLYEQADKLWTKIFERFFDMSKIHTKNDYTRVGRVDPLANALVKMDPMEPLREERDKALMLPLRTNLEKRVAELDAALRTGNYATAGTDAVRILHNADEAQKRFPRSTSISGETHARLKFIASKAADIPSIRRILDGALVPLPGNPRLKLSRTEIPQAFYSLVMDINPSANRGELLPVDSVSYADATAFAERVGWLIGVTVRLPTAGEYRTAAGVDNTAALRAQAAAARSFENSNNKPRAISESQPNSNGFCDILGNVAEWVQSPPKNASDPDALEIGGNYQDNRETLATLPLRTVPRHDRSRLRGLRIAVER